MEIKQIQTEYTLFNSIDELEKADVELIQEAHKATQKSYAPYSHFNVGCSVLLNNGEIISGANQENAAYPACICAERVVLSAVSAVFPNAIPLKMAIVAINKNKLNDTPAAPCGECRQALFEWEKRNKTAITLFLQGEKGKILHVKTVSDLLPFAFSKEDLI